MATGNDRPSEKPVDWSFFPNIASLLEAFKSASNALKAAVLGISLFAVLFFAVGLFFSNTLPAWAVVITFSLSVMLIALMVILLLLMERESQFQLRVETEPSPCRHVPDYPLAERTRYKIRDVLQEIQRLTFETLVKYDTSLDSEMIRANLFLLAEVSGGPDDGFWKLVIHPDLAIHMNQPLELGIQLSVGQGATGIAYRDGTFQLTRRMASPGNDWDQKFQMTPELNAMLHKELKWIISLPVLVPDTRQALAVLNIDGLTEFADDEILGKVSVGLRDYLVVIANALLRLPSTCVSEDRIGGIKRE
jgi:hypothetical protein